MTIQSIFLLVGDSGFVCAHVLLFFTFLKLCMSPFEVLSTSSFAPPFCVACSDVILEKHYAGVTSRTPVELFWEEVNKRTKRDVSAEALCAGAFAPLLNNAFAQCFLPPTCATSRRPNHHLCRTCRPSLSPARAIS